MASGSLAGDGVHEASLAADCARVCAGDGGGSNGEVREDFAPSNEG